jgi:isopentenyl diphosphate isomerase/L-lactate dehydrogenase-like FMN-dependent dehydrogenase
LPAIAAAVGKRTTVLYDSGVRTGVDVARAIALGAIGATLETCSFQARPFYERLGDRVVGAIDNYPPGHAKFFMRKALG